MNMFANHESNAHDEQAARTVSEGIKLQVTYTVTGEVTLQNREGEVMVLTNPLIQGMAIAEEGETRIIVHAYECSRETLRTARLEGDAPERTELVQAFCPAQAPAEVIKHVMDCAVYEKILGTDVPHTPEGITREHESGLPGYDVSGDDSLLI